MTQKFHFEAFTQENENTRPHRELYVNVHRGFIHSNPTLETAHIPTSGDGGAHCGHRTLEHYSPTEREEWLTQRRHLEQSQKPDVGLKGRRHVCGSIYMKFYESQTCGDGGQNGAFQGLWGGAGEGHQGRLGG